MAVQHAVITNTEFWEYAQRPENQRRWFELWNGVLVEMPSPSPLHGFIVAALLHRLMGYLDSHPIGYAVGDSNDFALATGVIFKPDAAFISKKRLPQLPQRYELAPDLAVEVVSPSNTPGELADKVETYLRYGTLLVWVIYPKEKTIRIYRPGEGDQITMQKVGLNDMLTGGEVLPDLTIPVRQIFPNLAEGTP